LLIDGQSSSADAPAAAATVTTLAPISSSSTEDRLARLQDDLEIVKQAVTDIARAVQDLVDRLGNSGRGDDPPPMAYRILQQQVAYHLLFKFPKAALIRVGANVIVFACTVCVYRAS
jgi:hypothetical protein